VLILASIGSSRLSIERSTDQPVAVICMLHDRVSQSTLGRFLSADTVQPNAPGSQGYNLYAYIGRLTNGRF